MVPSEEAHARMAPSSCGAHDTELTARRQTRHVRDVCGGRTGSLVLGLLLDLGPASRSGSLGLLLFPDDDLAVVRARGEDLAKLGVRPRDLPYGSCVTATQSAFERGTVTERF